MKFRGETYSKMYFQIIIIFHSILYIDVTPLGVGCARVQLKAFYVDLLVPLETNLEKDTKVVQVKWRNANSN